MKTAATALIGASFLLLAACGSSEPAATNELDAVDGTGEVVLPEENLEALPADVNALEADANAIDANAAAPADANVTAEANATEAE